MKAAFYTLGCKVNQYDTQMMKEKFESAGYQVTAFDTAADVYVVNTCTVTQISDKKSRNIIARARRRNPDAVIAVCGCFSQVSPAEAAAIEGVNVVIGTRNRADILYYIGEYLKTGRQIIDVERTSDIGREQITGFSDKTRAILKIEDGCRNFCSYCLIPFARGKIVSKPPEQVIAEVEAVVKNGYKEIVLTGIHLSSYGKDLGDCGLIDAIEAVSRIDGVCRIRLGSLEPTIVTPEFTERAAKIPQLCPAFHLSLQSGCDRTLRAMNRHYSTAQYAEAVHLLRTSFPGCAITTDIIVGFPGETEQHHAESLAFARRIGFAKIHIFPYSIRRGTKAAGMTGQLSKAVKQQREKELAAVEKKSRGKYLRAFVGKTVTVLTEQCENGVCSGFTDSYIQVKFAGSELDCNTLTNVTVTEASDDFLLAEK